MQLFFWARGLRSQDKLVERFFFEQLICEPFESSWIPFEKVLQILAVRLGAVKSTILDLGTGTGAWGIRLASRGFNVVGIDISLAELRAARRNAARIQVSSPVGSFDVVLGDVERLPFRNRAFDSCFCGGILHHIPDPRIAIKEIARIMNDGCVAAFEPSGQDPYRRLERSLMKALSSWRLQRRFSTPNETLHSLKTYIRICKQSGLANIWYESIRWPKLTRSNKLQFMDDCIKNMLWFLLPRLCGEDTVLIIAERTNLGNLHGA
jgi:ubiquinone/menaquinone biosynthesis C-methylase UbiE